MYALGHMYALGTPSYAGVGRDDYQITDYYDEVCQILNRK